MKFITSILLSILFLQLCGQNTISKLKEEKPFTISGSASINGIYMQRAGTLKGGSPLNYIFVGSPTISIYGFEIPLNFVFSPQGKSFQQPFNRYGASPQYKWVKIHLGYRNISYNPYTLDGHTIFGAGFDLTPGKWRFGFVYGRLAASTVIDTISKTLQPISFSRKGGSAKIGYGTSRNFIELSALSAVDDSTSIQADLTSLSTRYGKIIAPEGNLAFGLSTRLQLAKNISWDINTGISIFNRDTRNPNEIEEVNDNNIAMRFRKFIYINQSTELYSALQSKIQFKGKYFSIGLRYIRIDPEYKTMGVYYLNSDVKNYTILPNFNLFKRKVNVTSSIGFQNDNLNNIKRSTSNRIIASLSINAALSSKFNINTNYSNYSINQTPNVSRLADTFRIVQTTKNLNFTPIYTTTSKTVSKSIVFNVNYNNLADLNTKYVGEYQNKTIKATSYMLSVNYTKIIPKLGFMVGFNRNELDGSLIKDLNHGITLGITKNLNGKWYFGLNSTVLIGKRSEKSTTTTNFAASISYKLNKKQQLNFGSFLNNTILKGEQNGIRTRESIGFSRTNLSYIIHF